MAGSQCAWCSVGVGRVANPLIERMDERMRWLGKRTGRAALGGSAVTLGVVLAQRERKRLQKARAATAEARSLEQRALAERKRLRGELGRRDADLVHLRRLIERLQRSRRAEREWNNELRAQLQRAQVSRGALSDSASVRELVLKAAIELVDAEKGLLLSREDADADGDLDLVCALGFEGDAGDSALGQRFAREVLERDRIVREDSPSDDGAADDEIDNLVAIPLYLMDRFDGVIVCANRDGGFEELEDEVLLALGDHAGAALQTQRLQNDLNESHRTAVEILAGIIEAHDPLVHREAEEAALLARMLCRRLDLDESEHEVIAAAALLRDLGRVMIPDRVLLKPGPLSPEERSIVELHPRTGFRVIGRSSALDNVASAVLYHHERYDGTGYPTRLAGAAIPLAARAVAIADAYVAMTHERPYRPARSRDEAFAELTAGAGTQFDPELTQLFLEELRGGVPLFPSPGPAGTSELPRLRDEVPASDPLTQLPGHRTFRESVQRAVDNDGTGVTVAMVEIEGLAELNAGEGYSAGDRAILKSARSVELAARRVGGRAYRDSGRRLGILVVGRPESPQLDLAQELHIEFSLGPSIRVGVATSRSGESGDDVVDRARRALVTTVLKGPQH